MGKHRRQRQKLHSPAVKPQSQQNDTNMDTSPSQPILIQPSDNLFAGINIDLDTLKKDLPDDVQSVTSFKSLKSEKGGNKTLLKKDKIKLRREVLLKKLDAVAQVKLENKRRKKRKNVSIIGDTNPLHDALPSLQSLLDSTRPDSSKKKTDDPAKRKGVEKASKRKKQQVEGVLMFKQVMKNKAFQKDPLKMVAEQIKAVVEHGKMNCK